MASHLQRMQHLRSRYAHELHLLQRHQEQHQQQHQKQHQSDTTAATSDGTAAKVQIRNPLLDSPDIGRMFRRLQRQATAAVASAKAAAASGSGDSVHSKSREQETKEMLQSRLQRFFDSVQTARPPPPSLLPEPLRPTPRLLAAAGRCEKTNSSVVMASQRAAPPTSGAGTADATLSVSLSSINSLELVTPNEDEELLEEDGVDEDVAEASEHMAPPKTQPPPPPPPPPHQRSNLLHPQVHRPHQPQHQHQPSQHQNHQHYCQQFQNHIQQQQQQQLPQRQHQHQNQHQHQHQNTNQHQHQHQNQHHQHQHQHQQQPRQHQRARSASLTQLPRRGRFLACGSQQNLAAPALLASPTPSPPQHHQHQHQQQRLQQQQQQQQQPVLRVCPLPERSQPHLRENQSMPCSGGAGYHPHHQHHQRETLTAPVPKPRARHRRHGSATASAPAAATAAAAASAQSHPACQVFHVADVEAVHASLITREDRRVLKILGQFDCRAEVLDTVLVGSKRRAVIVYIAGPDGQRLNWCVDRIQDLFPAWELKGQMRSCKAK